MYIEVKKDMCPGCGKKLAENTIKKHLREGCPKKEEKERSRESSEEEKTALGVRVAKDSNFVEPTRPRRSEGRMVSATTVRRPKPVKKFDFEKNYYIWLSRIICICEFFFFFFSW